MGDGADRPHPALLYWLSIRDPLRSHRLVHLMGLYGLAVALFALAVIGAGAVGYSKGSASRNPEIATLEASIATSKELARQAERKAAETAAQVVTVYKDRVKVIRETVPGETQLVEVIRRDSTCDLPPSFRVLHDTAAGSPTPQDSAEPVGAAVAAQTIAENYRAARETAAKLEALQAYLNRIEEAK